MTVKNQKTGAEKKKKRFHVMDVSSFTFFPATIEAFDTLQEAMERIVELVEEGSTRFEVRLGGAKSANCLEVDARSFKPDEV